MKKSCVVPIVAVLFCLSCTGSIEDSSPSDPSQEMDPRGGPGSSNTFEQPVGCSASAVPKHLVVHRLNRVEYNNTVRDSLGDTSQPADEFSPDSGDGLFDNNADNLLVSVERLSQYEAAALRLGRKALTDPAFAACKDVACARRALEPFAGRAWRRPLTAPEVNELAALLQELVGNGNDFGDALAMTIEKVLLSPNFLYRFEYPPDAAGTAPYALDGYALASRLSYFLWSSMPDGPLMAAAASGKLAKDPREVDAQVARMLAHRNASALADNLAGQWLLGRKAFGAVPDPLKFPQFDDSLRAAIPQETALFVQAFIQENRDLRTMLTADFTFVNERLAQHYKINSDVDVIKGEPFKKVMIASNGQRGGLLTQAAFLIATSKPEEPSVPKRGAVVLSNLLCTTPPPPPANAKTVQASLDQKMPNATERQRSADRGMLPACGGCHAAFDPIGLGLQNFDATGAWRTVDGQKRPIDPSGTLPEMGAFAGPRGMSRLLAAHDKLPGCMSTVFLRYALGRLLNDADHCFIDDMTKEAVSRGFRAQDVVAAVARSMPFRFQGPGETP